MLAQKFRKALASASPVAQNSYLVHLTPAVDSLEETLPILPELQSYADRLDKLLDDANFAVKPNLTNDFAQCIGEAQFWILCHNKGIALRRIDEVKGKKTPDFEASAISTTLFFEVKTLSVVDGGYGIENALNSSLDANLDIERQLRQGTKIAMATSVVQPYGRRPYEEGSLLAVVNTLIEKTTQNIKRDQFGKPYSFLVLNMSVIPPKVTKPKVLRPSYPDDLMFPKAVTGELWAMAFGRVGMPIQVNPEYEGKPCVEGILDKVGILGDDNFDFISGILFVIHPWNEPSQLWGLYRKNDWENWNDNNGKLCELLLSLTGCTNWNDSGDTNGWRITV